MMIGELQIREMVRLRNEEVQQRHLEREAQAGSALRALSWTETQLSVYQARVASIGIRLGAVLARKPKVMRNRRLVR